MSYLHYTSTEVIALVVLKVINIVDLSLVAMDIEKNCFSRWN